MEWKGTHAYRLKLSLQACSIHDIFRVLLLEPYIYNGHTAPEPPWPIEINGEEGYELEEILQSEYRYGTLRYCMTYKGYSVECSNWPLAENLTYTQDIVRDFHALHSN